MNISKLTLICVFFFIGILQLPELFLVLIIFLAWYYKIPKRTVAVILLSLFFGLYLSINWERQIENDVETLSNSTVNSITVKEILEQDLNYQYFIGNPIDSKINVVVTSFNSEELVNIGDSYSISGYTEKLANLEDGYREYLESKNVHMQIMAQSIEYENSDFIGNFFDNLKINVQHRLNSNLDFEVASFNSGLLIGVDPSLSENNQENIDNLGLSHILSASGFNVGLIFLLLSKLLPFEIKKKRYITILIIWMYTFVVGLESVGTLRAAIMLTYILIALNLGRKNYFQNSISFSIICILLIYPFYYTNVSFQLSVAATIGIFYLAKQISTILKKVISSEFIAESISVTTSAIVCTYPIIVYHFGSTQPGDILANIFIIPLVPILTLYSLLLVIIDIFNIELFLNILSTTIAGLTEFTFLILKQLSQIGLVGNTLLLILAILIFESANKYYKNYSTNSNY